MRRGHRLEDIGNYTLAQFTMCLRATEELDADDRMATVTDLSVVVGSLFSSEEPPIVEHVASLLEASIGVKNGRGKPV